MRRTGVWVCVQATLSSTRFSEFQSLQYFRTQRRSTWVGKQRFSPFFRVSSEFGFRFWLAWERLPDSASNNGSNSSYISLQHLNYTQPLEENQFHFDPFSRISLSLGAVVVGEEDGLEEDVERISCFESIIVVERSELEEELVEKPRTTIGTKFSVSHCIRIPFWWDVVFGRWCNLTCTITSSCVCTSPLEVLTVVGQHDFVKVSISASVKSFWLIMCIDAPESTTNSRSSGLRVDAGKHLFSEGEKKVASFFSLNLPHPWPASTLLRGHLPLATLSPPETDPQILERWDCADEVHLGKCIRA